MINAVVRIPKYELIKMTGLLINPSLISIDFYPPASGPELELTFALNERLAVWLCESNGLTVLASKELSDD